MPPPFLYTPSNHQRNSQYMHEKTSTHSHSLSSEPSSEKQQELPHLRSKPKRKKVNRHPLVVNLADCKYVVVKQVAKALKFNITRQANSEWDLTWTDNAVTPQTLSRMRPHQKINHFPAMFNLSRKNYLARNLNKMKKAFPDEYNFYPQTWTLPAEYNDLRQHLQNEVNPVVIAKPEASCQGKGIFLTKNIEEFTYGQHYVVQKYIKKPFLIEGLKFDLRVYVLVAGCDPLRTYVYKEGLARFATEPYSQPKKENLGNLFMHLTNYAINKASTKFEFNHSSERMDVGHKRSLTSILDKLKELGHDSQVIWKDICLIITKTIISVQPILAHTYRSCQPDNLANNMCFEILGFDVMLDDQLKPIILEVNYTPSFTTDTPLDTLIKQNLIRDTLLLMNLSNKAKHEALSAKKKEMIERTLTGKKIWKSKEEREEEIKKISNKRDKWQSKHIGNFQKIYPPIPEEYPQEATINLERFVAHSQACYLSGTGANIKRYTKISLPSNTASDFSETLTKKEPVPKFTKADQLQRIYMKKQKPMVVKVKGNRSQLKEERQPEQMAESSMGRNISGHQIQHQKQMPRAKAYQSVQKFGGVKYEVTRISTLERKGVNQEFDEKGQPLKKGRSALSRVYNIAFRQMKPTR